MAFLAWKLGGQGEGVGAEKGARSSNAQNGRQGKASGGKWVLGAETYFLEQKGRKLDR